MQMERDIGRSRGRLIESAPDMQRMIIQEGQAAVLVISRHSVSVTFARNRSQILGAPRLDQVHDHDVAVAERKMIRVALLLHAFDLCHVLKKHR